MPVHEIPRVPMPEPADFFRRYVHERAPVVVTGLFAGQPVDGIRTIEAALDAWGDMSLRVQDEYASADAAVSPEEPRVLAFRDYVAFTRANPSTLLCCTEYETPARVLASFRLPAVCTASQDHGEEVFGLPRKYGDHDLVTNLFVANPGNVAHLHFDGDQREVLLHQVYGRKRVVLFPPAAAKHLCTLDGPPTRPSLAGVDLEGRSPEDLLAFVDDVGGFHTVLEPGETLYIPKLLWHHLEYLDDAMSFNLRFGRSRYGRFLSLDNFHRDPYTQNVGAAIGGPPEALDAFAPVIDEITAAYLQPVPDVAARVRQMRALFRELCTRLCPDASAEELCPPEREEEQVARIVAGRDMQGGLKYADPAMVTRTRPVGPISERQVGIIDGRLRDLGYSPEVERAVLGNRFGKGDLAELTKIEGALLIDYLTTPGAAW